MHTDHFDGRHALDNVEGLLQHLFDMPAVIRHTSHAQHRFLPEVLSIHFGDGEVELAAQAILHAMQDPPLVLKRLTLRYPQLDGAHAYDHPSHVATLTASAA